MSMHLDAGVMEKAFLDWYVSGSGELTNGDYLSGNGDDAKTGFYAAWSMQQERIAMLDMEVAPLHTKVGRRDATLKKFDYLVDELTSGYGAASCINPLTDMRNAIIKIRGLLADATRRTAKQQALILRYRNEYLEEHADGETDCVTPLDESLYGGTPELDILVAEARKQSVPDVSRMVDRFLGWKLPKDFGPDCGISFKRESDYDHPIHGRTKYEPIGTNLLYAGQAREMIEYMLAAAAPTPEVPHE